MNMNTIENKNIENKNIDNDEFTLVQKVKKTKRIRTKKPKKPLKLLEKIQEYPSDNEEEAPQAPQVESLFDEEFPTLANATKKVPIPQTARNTSGIPQTARNTSGIPQTARNTSGIPRSKAVANLTTYIVSSSYIEEKQRKQRETNRQFDRRSGHTTRDKAFATLENKEQIAKTLTCTKACRHVTENITENQFGVCYRDVCTFAHSLDEFQDPQCSFGVSCRHIQGRRDFLTGDLDRTKKCMFRHPNESREQYVLRTGKTLPNLPQTSEQTRKPITKVDLEDLTVEGAKRKAARKAAMENIDKSVADKAVADKAEKETVLHVPKCLFEQTMQMAISQGLTNFRIEVTE